MDLNLLLPIICNQYYHVYIYRPSIGHQELVSQIERDFDKNKKMTLMSRVLFNVFVVYPMFQKKPTDCLGTHYGVTKTTEVFELFLLDGFLYLQLDL